MTHWSTRSLAQVAVEREIVPQIAHSTVSLILRSASLQPHRSRYWKTPTLNEEFRARASRILWCYENAARLAEKGELVICLDEKPGIQALERKERTRSMRPGQIERQEFEYERHGVVNFLVALIVHDGQMRGWCLPQNDSEHLCEALRFWLAQWRHKISRIHLIWDNGPSHIAGNTKQFLQKHSSWIRVLYTPVHASWLNQAELLLRSFNERYLKRGSWASQQALIDHLSASWKEYNRLYACPITWSWTRQSMHKWLDEKLALNI